MSSVMNDPSGEAQKRRTQQTHQEPQAATLWGYYGGQAIVGLLGVGAKLLLILLPILGGVLFGGVGIFIAMVLDVALIVWLYWPTSRSTK